MVFLKLKATPLPYLLGINITDVSDYTVKIYIFKEHKISKFIGYLDILECVNMIYIQAREDTYIFSTTDDFFEVKS